MVNGQTVTRQGVCVDPKTDRVEVDGRTVGIAQSKVYVLLNKPRDVLCTSHDTHGRRTFLDLLPDLKARLFSVGRLDRDSEGALLVTNDGDLALALMHPRHEVPKTYHVRVNGPLPKESILRMTRGIESDGQVLRAVSVRLRPDRDTDYEIVLREGRNRQIRRMIEAVGARVVSLKRVAIGSLSIRGLRSGAWRHLTPAERQTLLREAGGATRPRHDAGSRIRDAEEEEE